MILLIALAAIVVAVLLSWESTDLLFDWQVLLPMVDDTLTLIGLLLAIVVYVLVIALRTQRLITAPVLDRDSLNLDTNKRPFNEKEPVLSLMAPVIHNLNQ